MREAFLPQSVQLTSHCQQAVEEAKELSKADGQLQESSAEAEGLRSAFLAQSVGLTNRGCRDHVQGDCSQYSWLKNEPIHFES